MIQKWNTPRAARVKAKLDAGPSGTREDSLTTAMLATFACCGLVAAQAGIWWALAVFFALMAIGYFAQAAAMLLLR